MSASRPSVEQIAAAPELGVLAVLEMAAAVAIVALAVAWPELNDDADPEFPEPRAALDVIDHARRLHAAIHRYRLALTTAAERERDLPF